MVVQPRVAVIGCGPGGISILHALAMKKKKMEEEGDLEGLAKLPIITVFERDSQPGGVWRSDSDSPCSGLPDQGNKNPNVGESAEVVIDANVSKEELGKVKSDSDHNTDFGSSSDSKSADDSDDKSIDTLSPIDTSTTTASVAVDQDEDEDYIWEGKANGSSTSMYEALWTNGPSQAIEFYDYTFDEHFEGKPMPIFMPRSALLEYILARVTRNNPTIFDCVRFNTTVDWVGLCEDDNSFEFELIDNITGKTTFEYFDKCIWAAGANGFAKIPKSIRSILKEGKFKGIDVHSSQAADHLVDLKDKTILMIGDGLSAEDLSHQAIKLGVGKIYILARSGEGVCSYTSNWPFADKVEMLHDMVVSEVIQQGRGVRFTGIERNRGKIINHNDTYDINDVDAVIYCTGYDPNTDMIDDSLFSKSNLSNWEMKDGLQFRVNHLPDDWKMKPNGYTPYIGHVSPSKLLCTDCDYLSLSGAYHNGVQMDNPNIMYLEDTSEYPLMEIDIKAWYMLSLITGDVELPNENELEAKYSQILQAAMDNAHIRRMIDDEYKIVFDQFFDIMGVGEIGESKADAIDSELDLEAEVFAIKQIALLMQEARYPLQLGSLDKLNEKGELLVKMSSTTNAERYAKGRSSKSTFRDVDPANFKSLHTRKQAAALKAKWMDIDDKDPDLLNLNQN